VVEQTMREAATLLAKASSYVEVSES
jgi:hypothetical protein